MSALATEAIAGIVVGSVVLLGLGYGLSKNNKQHKHDYKNEDKDEDKNEDKDKDEDKVSYRKSATLGNIGDQYPDNDPIYKGVNSKNKLRFGKDQVRTIPARVSARVSARGKRKSKKSKKRY